MWRYMLSLETVSLRENNPDVVSCVAASFLRAEMWFEMWFISEKQCYHTVWTIKERIHYRGHTHAHNT